MKEKQINYYRGAKCPKCGRFMKKIVTSKGRRGWIYQNLACEDGRGNIEASWLKRRGR